MSVHKQSVSFTDAASAFARALVDAGEYLNISAAVSRELARARASRDQDRRLFEAKLQRRLALPVDRWEPLHPGQSLTADARAHATNGMQSAAMRR